ncbi:MAG: hypothetical protein ACRED1_05955, partial [Limisphaerales bacterium]
MDNTAEQSRDRTDPESNLQTARMPPENPPRRKTSSRAAPAFYRGRFWRFGLMAARAFPSGLLRA